MVSQQPICETLSEDPFRRQGNIATQASVDLMSSVIVKPEWYITPTTVATVLGDAKKQIYSMSIWHLMNCIEETCGDCGMQYFHPDPMTIYTRSSDGHFYASVNAVFVSSDEMDLTLMLHKGPMDHFEDFKDRMFQILEQEQRHEK